MLMRHTDDEIAADLEYAIPVVEGILIVINMFQEVTGEDRVLSFVIEGQSLPIVSRKVQFHTDRLIGDREALRVSAAIADVENSLAGEIFLDEALRDPALVASRSF